MQSATIAVQRLVLSTFPVGSRLFRAFGLSGISAKYKRKLKKEEVFGDFAFPCANPSLQMRFSPLSPN